MFGGFARFYGHTRGYLKLDGSRNHRHPHPYPASEKAYLPPDPRPAPPPPMVGEAKQDVLPDIDLVNPHLWGDPDRKLRWPARIPHTRDNAAHVWAAWIIQRLAAQRKWAAWYRWIVLTGIVVVLWAGFAIRPFVGGGVDVYGIIHHFTNWSWIFIQTPFYTTIWWILTVYAIRDWWLDRKARRMGVEPAHHTQPHWLDYLLGGTIFMLFTVVWGDTAFVYLLVFTNTDAIADLFEDHQSSVSVGDLILGNEIYHAWPVFFILAFSWLYSDLVKQSLAAVLGGVNGALPWSILYTYLMFAGPAAPVLLYFSIFDPVGVYGVDGNTLTGILLLALNLTVVCVPLVYFYTPVTLPADVWYEYRRASENIPSP